MRYHKLTAVATAMLAGLALSQTVFATDYQIQVTNLTRGVHFTPLIAAAHDPAVRMFHAGNEATTELQTMAEGGNVSPLAEMLTGLGATVGTGEGLLAPGHTATLLLHDVGEGTVLSMAGMLLPTNDGFVGVDSAHFPMSGSMTLLARGYDAGTEANDELVGGGAPGVAGFPAPPPVVATGTGSNGTGVPVTAEGYVHVHPGVLGDLDPQGGVSDINAGVHRWQNPVARVLITRMGGGNGNGPSAVGNLSGAVYSSSAVELFWDPANSDDSTVVSYRVTRNGSVVNTFDGLSYFDHELSPGTGYTYSVTPMDANGESGETREIELTTNAI